MSPITDLYQQCELVLDGLGSELHALSRDHAAGHYVDSARVLIVEGLEIACKLVMQQIDTLDAYDQSLEVLNLADPELERDIPEAPADERSDPAQVGGI